VVVASTPAAPTFPRRPMIVSRHADWFPDGRRIAFESNLERPKTAYAIGEEVAFADPGLDIYIVAEDGTQLVNLTRDHPDGADVYPSVSPDGTRIAFLRRDEGATHLAVTDLDGSRARVLARDVSSVRPTWSRDGREIAFAACCEGGLSQLYAIGPDGGGRRRIAEGASPIAWAPDGSRIAFFGFPNGNPGILVADRSGESLRLVARMARSNIVSWSHDAATLAFNSESSERFRFGVAVVPAAGGPITRLVDRLSEPPNPAWSPVRRQLAYGGDSLWTIDADGSAGRLVAEGDGRQGDPSWSPDGERILFTTEFPQAWFPEVGSYLEVVRPDGSGRIRITPESPPATEIIVPVGSVVPPARLQVRSITLRPEVVQRGGTVTAQVVVETQGTGYLVDGARVFVYARPKVFRVSPRPALTRSGKATVRLRLVGMPRTRRSIWLSVVASRPGDDRVTSFPFLTVVPVRR
jgi:Tol biopolymer transport system component